MIPAPCLWGLASLVTLTTALPSPPAKPPGTHSLPSTLAFDIETFEYPIVQQFFSSPSRGPSAEYALESKAVKALPKFTALHVFGDSWVDGGNVLLKFRKKFKGTKDAPRTVDSPNRGPYHASGTFSDGQAFPFHIAKALGSIPTNHFLRYSNWAFGGSTVDNAFVEGKSDGVPVPDLMEQTATFAAKAHADLENSLAIVCTGGNDYEQKADPQNTVASLMTALETLYEAGLRHIVVFQLPETTKIPLVQFLPADAKQVFDQSVKSHNSLLAAELETFHKETKPVLLLTLDTILSATIDNLAGGPLDRERLDKPCFLGYTEMGEKNILRDPTKQLWFDECHFTAVAHRLIAGKVMLAMAQAWAVKPVPMKSLPQ